MQYKITHFINNFSDGDMQCHPVQITGIKPKYTKQINIGPNNCLKNVY